jgi:hypothetical protein
VDFAEFVGWYNLAKSNQKAAQWEQHWDADRQAYW